MRKPTKVVVRCTTEGCNRKFIKGWASIPSICPVCEAKADHNAAPGGW